MAKVAGLSLILLFALLTTTQMVRAQFSNPTPYLQVILDKASYYPGDSGTVSVDIKDTLSINIVIYNITIIFPWRAYINGQWDGNKTIYPNGQTGQAVQSGAWLPTVKISFTTPSDSRYFYAPYYFYGGSAGQVTVWASGVGPSGGPGSFNTNFPFVSAYFAGALEARTQTYIWIVMTVIIGVMAGTVIYYVRVSLKLKRASAFASPPATSQTT